ncbi:MAG: methionine ABC transporter ATP-binding protein [Propionibacteriaceae bacterium]|jgi:D-methionine transport system ATP-binding protein|nr:methionine ABC transporter ATP-binding protein [Propionibacteriaceae bacterium]
MALVEFRDVTKVFDVTPTKDNRRVRTLTVLDHVNLDIEQGEIFGLIGYSGAGKSTLVRLVNALTPVTSGSIKVGDVEVTTLKEHALQELRRGIGMVFQQFNLLNSRTVAGNVAYPLAVAGVKRAERDARVAELLSFVGLTDKAHAYPDQLSGGQKQRVGIARALANHPTLLLADEATSALDPETTQEVLALLRRVNAEFGTTIIVITHEMEVIRSTAHRVAVLDEGRIVEQGEVFEVFSRPQSPVTARFVATVIAPPPSGDALAALHAQHPTATLVTLRFDDTATDQTHVYRRFFDAQVTFELVAGGIEAIGAHRFAQLTLALTADNPDALADIPSLVGAGVDVEVHA